MRRAGVRERCAPYYLLRTRSRISCRKPDVVRFVNVYRAPKHYIITVRVTRKTADRISGWWGWGQMRNRCFFSRNAMSVVRSSRSSGRPLYTDKRVVARYMNYGTVVRVVRQVFYTKRWTFLANNFISCLDKIRNSVWRCSLLIRVTVVLVWTNNRAFYSIEPPESQDRRSTIFIHRRIPNLPPFHFVTFNSPVNQSY